MVFDWDLYCKKKAMLEIGGRWVKLVCAPIVSWAWHVDGSILHQDA